MKKIPRKSTNIIFLMNLTVINVSSFWGNCLPSICQSYFNFTSSFKFSVMNFFFLPHSIEENFFVDEIHWGKKHVLLTFVSGSCWGHGWFNLILWRERERQVIIEDCLKNFQHKFFPLFLFRFSAMTKISLHHLFFSSFLSLLWSEEMKI